MKTPQLILLVFCLVLMAGAQRVGFRKFEGKAKKFTFFYPLGWVYSKEDQTGTYFSQPTGSRGGINVLLLENVSMPVEKIRKNMLLFNYKHTDAVNKVKVVPRNGVDEYYYRFENDETKSMVKAYQKGNDFYAIVVNWDTASWKQYSDTLLYSYNSFRPK